MKFDVIIGNPPYQLNDGGFGSSAAPIYQHFVEQAIKLDPQLLTLVIPARWYSGGKGLNEFRESMLENGHLSVLHDFPNTNDVFPGVNVRGGICYFLWERDFQGNTVIHTHEKGEVISTAERPLLEPGASTFIRYNEGVSILRKVVDVEGNGKSGLPEEKSFSKIVSSRKPFGLDTTFRGHQTPGKKDVLVYQNGGVSYMDRADVPLAPNWIDTTKLFVPYASPGSDDYPHLVLSKPLLSGPGEVATETYLLIGPFDDEAIAKNAASYMATKFFRFMVTLSRSSQHVTRSVYKFVPIQDFSKPWTDQELFDKYNIDDDEIEFISRYVKDVSWADDYS